MKSATPIAMNIGRRVGNIRGQGRTMQRPGPFPVILSRRRRISSPTSHPSHGRHLGEAIEMLRCAQHDGFRVHTLNHSTAVATPRWITRNRISRSRRQSNSIYTSLRPCGMATVSTDTAPKATSSLAARRAEGRSPGFAYSHTLGRRRHHRRSTPTEWHNSAIQRPPAAIQAAFLGRCPFPRVSLRSTPGCTPTGPSGQSERLVNCVDTNVASRGGD
jgi:hypothetical protein